MTRAAFLLPSRSRSRSCSSACRLATGSTGWGMGPAGARPHGPPDTGFGFLHPPRRRDVRRARDEFTSADGDRGWTVERVQGRRFSKTELLELAHEVDSGFDVRVFIDMLRHLARYGDVDLALGDVDIAALRAFFQQWMTELEAR